VPASAMMSWTYRSSARWVWRSPLPMRILSPGARPTI